MTFLTFTSNNDLYHKAALILRQKFGCSGEIEIDFSRPKPTFAGAYYGVYDFSISHSGEIGAIAVSDHAAGCDIEILKGKEHLPILGRLSAEERREIADEKHFLANWTAKEAFIKLNGYALATHLRRLQFYGGKLYLDGRAVNCPVVHFERECAVACVCGDDDVRICDI